MPHFASKDFPAFDIANYNDIPEMGEMTALPKASARLSILTKKTGPAPLPPELWCIIIKYLNGDSLEDLAFLWLTVRRVAKAFEAEVERVFAKERLLGSRLDGDCGKCD